MRCCRVTVVSIFTLLLLPASSDQTPSGPGKSRKGSAPADHHPRVASSKSQPLNLSQVTMATHCSSPCQRLWSDRDETFPVAADDDIIIPGPTRKWVPEATAHLSATRLRPLVLQRPLRRGAQPVRLPGLGGAGVRVPGCGPGRVVPPRQGGRGLLLPGPAAEKPKRFRSRTAGQPAAGGASLPPTPEETDPVPLPVRRRGLAPHR